MKNFLTLNSKKNNYIIIPLINFLFSVFLWIIIQCNLGFNGMIMCFILLGLYIIFFILLNLFDSVICFYYNMLYMYFIITLTYRKLIGINAINWLNFIDVLLLILTIKFIISRLSSHNKINDSILHIYVLFILLFSFISLLNGNSISNIISVAFIYFRTLPIYFIITFNKNFFKKLDIKLFLIQCAIPAPILLWKYSVDDFGGIFGIFGVTPFSLITIFLFGIVVGAYINNKFSFFKFLFFNILFYMFWILGEVKFAILLAPILEILLILIKNKKLKKRIEITYKKVAILVFVPLISIIAFYTFLFFNQKWKSRINSVGLLNYIFYYATGATNHSDMSRFDVIIYSYNNILTSVKKKFFGLGIGSAMPPQYFLFDFRDNLLGRNNNYLSFYNTSLYEKYSYNLGYHNTGFGTVFLESGILGISCFIIIFFIIFYRSFKLLKSKNEIHSIIGYGGLMFVIYLFPIFVYYNFIVRIRMYATIMIIFGIISRFYRIEKIQR